jgi:hypothetical protein
VTVSADATVAAARKHTATSVKPTPFAAAAPAHHGAPFRFVDQSDVHTFDLLVEN